MVVKVSLKAVNHINVELNNSVLAMDSSETYSVDKAMIDEDKTHDKARLGANSILAVSIAAARAAAQSLHMPLYRFLGGVAGTTLPVPLMNIIKWWKTCCWKAIFRSIMIGSSRSTLFQGSFKNGNRSVSFIKGHTFTEGICYNCW